MFLPTTPEEVKALGWDRPDIVLVTGDAYIDSPHVGVAVIGKYLMRHGFKAAIIAQPGLESGRDISRLGEPKLFWGVTAGCIDSMVANYTAVKKFRNQDDYTPGGVNIRPDRAAIAYTNLIRRYFKDTKPIVLGGMEASLRRIAHYDYWSGSVRRSIIFDAKADMIAYGMAEKTVVDLSRAFAEGRGFEKIPGICYISNSPVEGYVELPSFEEVREDKNKFCGMFKTFYDNANSSITGFIQKHGGRYLVHNPAQEPMTSKELDGVYSLDFERDAHPYYKTGEIRALETIKQSITTHRGCFGKCSFCAIGVHQGWKVVSRSIESVIEEAKRITGLKGFNGIIYDVGGATANMYSAGCKADKMPCRGRNCLTPQPCPNLKYGHRQQVELLDKLLKIRGVKKVFVSSGIRYDMVVNDREYGKKYVDILVEKHISGQIKVAPEHYDNEVLALMNKPSIKPLMRFKMMFDESCRQKGKKQFLTYYLMAAHPGCTAAHMLKLKDFLKGGLGMMPEQVQIFTPTPSTLSACMYWSGTDLNGNSIFCERNTEGKQRQKDIIRDR